MGLFLVAFGLYLRTLHPAYQLDDSPWTVAACATLGTQHAPGYPLLTLLGRLALTLPVGGPYFRVNLLAAVLGAGGAVAAAFLCARLLAPSPLAPAAALFAGAALALTRVWWECALSAKGAVYLLNALLLAAATALLVARRPRRAAAPAALALANHWMSAVWWGAAIGWAGRPWSPRRVAFAGVPVALSASLYLQLPLCARHEPVWGDPVTPGGLLDIILRRTFLPQAALKPAGWAPLQAAWEFFAPWRESGDAVFVLALAGAAVLWRSRRREAAVLLAPVALLLGAVAAVSNPVHVVTGQWMLWLTDRFLLPWHFAVAVLAGCGVALAAFRRAGRSRLVLGMAWLLLLGSGVGRWDRLDHASDYLGFDYAENLRASVTRPGTVLAEADYQCFPLVALQRVEQREPGLRFVITNPFLDRPGGWRRLKRVAPESQAAAGASILPLTGRPDEASGVRLAALADVFARQGPVFQLPLCSYPELRRRMRWHGLLAVLAPDGAAAAPPAEPAVARLFVRLRLRGLHPRVPWKDEAAFSVLDIYGQARAAPGAAAFAATLYEDALAACRRGLAFPGALGSALLWTTAGHAAARLNRFAEAEASFRRALALRPRDLDLLTNVATACAAQGRADEAMRYFTLVLERDPRNAAARANLALLRRQIERVPY